MVAYLFRMPSGIQGDISRRQSSTVESGILNPLLPFASYGVFGKIVSGKFIPLVANDVATSIYALFARPYPTTGANASDPLGTSAPITKGIADMLRRGYMTVINNSGTPAVDGQVFVRVANPSTGKPINGIEAVFESTVTGTAGTNTGNGTIGSLSSTVNAPAGSFVVTMLTATTFSVIDPSGNRLADGVTGSAYTYKGLSFTITVGGTAFVAGDSFTVANVQNTIAVPNCVFTTTADADGNVEISYNI